MSFRALVDLAKMRWRIERDYLELKQEIGLGQYEGRGWPGFQLRGIMLCPSLTVWPCKSVPQWHQLSGKSSPLHPRSRPSTLKTILGK
jgi:hypothetical protein